MSFALNKVKRRSAEIEAADVLRAAIVSGQIALGTRLTEINVASQLGVSRTTVRTVFHQLVQEGLVVQIPYVGWSVMTLSADDAWELYTLRASLEALAARLVARSVGAPETREAVRKELSARFEELASACRSGSRDAVAVADMRLHRAIVDLSGHRLLATQYDQIQHQIQIYIRSSDALVSEPEQIIAQHEPMIDRIIAGDEEGAVEAAVTHNESEGAILVKVLRDTESAATTVS